MKKLLACTTFAVAVLLGATGCTNLQRTASWDRPPAFAKGTFTVVVQGDRAISPEEYVEIQEEIARRLAGSGLTLAGPNERADYVVNVTLEPTYGSFASSTWWFDDPYYWGPFGYRSWGSYSYYPHGYFGRYPYYDYPYYYPPYSPPVVVNPPPKPPPTPPAPGTPPVARPPVVVNGRIPLQYQNTPSPVVREGPRPTRNDAVNGRIPLSYVRNRDNTPPPQTVSTEPPRPIQSAPTVTTARTDHVRAINGRVPFSSRQNNYRPEPSRRHMSESRAEFSGPSRSSRSESSSSSSSSSFSSPSSSSSSPSRSSGSSSSSSSTPRAVNGRIPLN